MVPTGMGEASTVEQLSVGECGVGAVANVNANIRANWLAMPSLVANYPIRTCQRKRDR